LELVAPAKLTEGFQALAPAQPAAPGPITAEDGQNSLTSSFPRRGDVGPTREQKGYRTDKRYIADWADVQRIGVKNDWCRMVYPEGGKEDTSFFACALGGSGSLSSVKYRTKAIAEGFRRSRDDYLNKLRKGGATSYCRILKDKDGTWQPLCLEGADTGFGTKDLMDPNPPEEITTLLEFYRGAKGWLRLRDDMLDYTGNLFIQKAGGLAVEESPPRPTVTRGLKFNGVDQFLRIGDQDDLSLGSVIPLRQLRAFTLWVKFDEFTNNAHIFDFGDGPGMNNTFLGIYRTGDLDRPSGNEVRPGPVCQESTVPTGPSGAQCVPEVRPQKAMVDGRGNVDEYTCLGPEVLVDEARAVPILPREEAGTGPRSRATLLYEVWDSRLRKMQIRLNRVIPLGAWTHIAITAASADALRPNIQVWINGNLWFTKESGCLPQADTTAKNYIGKSNWTDKEDLYELRDELFKGSIFDFRMYSTPLSETKIKRTLQWGMGLLGVTADQIASSG
jgi:hypothetical protein